MYFKIILFIYYILQFILFSHMNAVIELVTFHCLLKFRLDCFINNKTGMIHCTPLNASSYSVVLFSNSRAVKS